MKACTSVYVQPMCMYMLGHLGQSTWLPYGLQPATLLSSWDSPCKNTMAHAFLQGIFLDPGLNLRLPELQADSLPLVL